MTDEVRRPGYYGRVYGDWGTHPKVVGGVLPSGKRCRRLSLAARGLWCSLLSLVIRRKAKGVFAAEDAEAEAGAEWSALVSELEANELADPHGDGVWVLHDWASNGASVEKYEENKAKQREWTRESRARKALREADVSPDRLDLSPSDIQEERDSEGKGAGKALHVADAHTPANEGRGNASMVRPISAAALLARPQASTVSPRAQWASALFNAVAAHWRGRGVPCPDRAGRDPSHKVWGDLADYMMDRAVMRRWPDDAPTREAKSAALVAAYYASKDPRTCTAEHSLDYLAARPGQYTGDRKAS